MSFKVAVRRRSGLNLLLFSDSLSSLSLLLMTSASSPAPFRRQPRPPLCPSPLVIPPFGSPQRLLIPPPSLSPSSYLHPWQSIWTFPTSDWLPHPTYSLSLSLSLSLSFSLCLSHSLSPSLSAEKTHTHTHTQTYYQCQVTLD